MEIDKPYLFIEINEKNFVFLAVKYNENFSFEVLHSISTNSNGVRDGIIYNTEISLKIIKESLNTIEKKINFIFRSATIIINHNNFTCTNISGFKRLNGSQVLEGNISYIINNLKKIVLDNEPEKHLVKGQNRSHVAHTVSSTRIQRRPTPTPNHSHKKSPPNPQRSSSELPPSRI